MSQFTGKSGFELKTFILFYFLNSFYFLQPLQCPQDSVRRQSTFYFSTFCFSFWASPPYPWWLEGPFKSIGFIEVIFISHWLNCNLWNKSTGLQIFHFSFLLRKTYTDSINMQPETMDPQNLLSSQKGGGGVWYFSPSPQSYSLERSMWVCYEEGIHRAWSPS